MSNPHSPNDPSWRNSPATWSKPSTWVIGTVVALAIIFGAAFLFGGRAGTDTAEAPINPPAGAQINTPPAASPPATTGAGNGQR